MQLIAQFQEQEKKAERGASQAPWGEGRGRKSPEVTHPSWISTPWAPACTWSATASTQRQLAVISAKAHNNSTMNPLAQYTFPMTVDEVMADREVAWPLTRAMCAPIGDGAAAAIVCSKKFMKKLGQNRAVRIRASVLKSGRREGENDICARASDAAYAMAGIGPKDINVAEVHDATAFGELYQTEQMGFCPDR